MPKNSSGAYTQPAGTAASSGATISSTKYNELVLDLGTAISESLDTQGRNGMTGPLKVSDGTVTAPAIALTSEPDRGIYKTANGLGFTIDGVKVGEVTSAGVLDGSGNAYQTASTVAWTDTASAATVDLSSLASENIRITGSTTITALDDTVAPANSGVTKTLRFSGALTLTHNATSLILPTAANITTAAGDTCVASSLGGGNWVVTDYQRASGLPLANPTTGKIGQVVETASGAVATGTTIIPEDDTIPQITEGNEYLTATITPSSATSTLLIEALWVGANSAAGYHMAVALFQDATANALAVTSQRGPNDEMIAIPLSYKMAAGTTSATTFRLRAGSNTAGTTTFNGFGAARKFGGVLRSYLRVTEILP